MIRLILNLTLALLFAPIALANTCPPATNHCYKEKIALDNDLFDPTMDCGLNLTRLEECVKEDRTNGRGESFCNSVKLYAGNKQKLMNINDSIHQDSANKDKHMPMMRTLNDIQTKFANDFMKAGLQPEQVSKIPPINNFVCKKVK